MRNWESWNEQSYFRMIVVFETLTLPVCLLACPICLQEINDSGDPKLKSIMQQAYLWTCSWRGMVSQ